MRTMYIWMMELELQFDAFLDSLHFPLSLGKPTGGFLLLTITYHSAYGALVATRVVSCLVVPFI